MLGIFEVGVYLLAVVGGGIVGYSGAALGFNGCRPVVATMLGIGLVVYVLTLSLAVAL